MKCSYLLRNFLHKFPCFSPILALFQLLYSRNQDPIHFASYDAKENCLLDIPNTVGNSIQMVKGKWQRKFNSSHLKEIQKQCIEVCCKVCYLFYFGRYCHLNRQTVRHVQHLPYARLWAHINHCFVKK